MIKKIIVSLLTTTCILLNACCEAEKPRPECEPDAPEVPGIYSKQIGNVNVAGENCQIFETYEKYNCGTQKWHRDPYNGCDYYCGWKILTRITKCPSQSTTNEIHRENCGKACSREAVQ